MPRYVKIGEVTQAPQIFPEAGLDEERDQVEVMFQAIWHYMDGEHEGSISFAGRLAERITPALWAMGLEIRPAEEPKRYTSGQNATATRHLLECAGEQLESCTLFNDPKARLNRRHFAAQAKHEAGWKGRQKARIAARRARLDAEAPLTPLMEACGEVE